MTDQSKITVPEEPPFGFTVLYGKKGAGKTLGALNSPWSPIHIIDTEDSSRDYQQHMGRLLEAGFLTAPFTRASCPTFEAFDQEVRRILKGSELYGTLIVDTMGQVATWVAEQTFRDSPAQAEKMSQVVWGKVRDRLRSLVLKLTVKSRLLVFTAHEREYNKVVSPRMNPAVLEIASLAVQLVRGPNTRMPDGIISGARIPWFPPRVSPFSFMALLQYFDTPADWDHLSEDQKAPNEMTSGALDIESMEMMD